MKCSIKTGQFEGLAVDLAASTWSEVAAVKLILGVITNKSQNTQM